MSRTLLQQDNISVTGEIIKSKDIDTGKEYNPKIKLHFTLLINGKLKVWGTNYDLEEMKLEWFHWLVNYKAWNDTKDFLCTLWYNLQEININNWINEFEIN